MRIPLRITIFDRGSGGIPTTTYVAEIASIVEECTLTCSNRYGFETFQCSFPATVDDALEWLNNRLMCSVLVTGPDAETVWEGYLETIEAQFGQERRSVSLRDMANRLRVRYTTVLGTPGVTATASDSASQALYGVKDSALALDTSDSTEAGHFRDAMLADLKNPQSGPSASVATGDSGEVRVTLSFAGWYETLGWLLTSNTSTTKTSTTTQVGTLLSDVAGTNAFISTSTANIVSSGITAVETIADDTPYREKIESLLKRGNGSYPYAWGVYEDRVFKANVYAAAAPDTITYQRWLGDSFVRDTSAGVIWPWNVRPDAMYQVVELLDVAPVATAKDAASRFYVARTSCQISGDTITLTLEPGDSEDLSAVLVTKWL